MTKPDLNVKKQFFTNANAISIINFGRMQSHQSVVFDFITIANLRLEIQLY